MTNNFWDNVENILIEICHYKKHYLKWDHLPFNTLSSNSISTGILQVPKVLQSWFIERSSNRTMVGQWFYRKKFDWYFHYRDTCFILMKCEICSSIKWFWNKKFELFMFWSWILSNSWNNELEINILKLFITDCTKTQVSIRDKLIFVNTK